MLYSLIYALGANLLGILVGFLTLSKRVITALKPYDLGAVPARSAGGSCPSELGREVKAT